MPIYFLGGILVQWNSRPFEIQNIVAKMKVRIIFAKWNWPKLIIVVNLAHRRFEIREGTWKSRGDTDLRTMVWKCWNGRFPVAKYHSRAYLAPPFIFDQTSFDLKLDPAGR